VRLVRDALPFELWTSLFAGDCALFFNSREDLIRGSNRNFLYLRMFGLLIFVGRGASASKTEAIYFPFPRQRADFNFAFYWSLRSKPECAAELECDCELHTYAEEFLFLHLELIYFSLSF
jgi:hypothetical protein